MLTIDIKTARRFILGKQGVWPGNRWQDTEAIEQAIREMEYLQLDPLQIIARSHDIQLHGRVFDCTPGLWEEAAYQHMLKITALEFGMPRMGLVHLSFFYTAGSDTAATGGIKCQNWSVMAIALL